MLAEVKVVSGGLSCKGVVMGGGNGCFFYGGT